MSTEELEREVIELEREADLLTRKEAAMARKQAALKRIAKQVVNPKWERVIQITSEVFGVHATRIMGRERSREVADARHVAIAEAYLDCGNYSKVATYFRRDHGTIMHAVMAVRSKQADPSFKTKLDKIKTKLAELT